MQHRAAPLLPLLAPGLSLALVVPTGGALARATPITPGRYCLKEAVSGFTGVKGHDIPLGDFLMEVVVNKSRAGWSVAFWNKQPDNPQILSNESTPARVERDGALRFDFTDGWGNRASGRVWPVGKVRLDILRDAPGNQIGRNYGDFRVKRRMCSAPEFNGH